MKKILGMFILLFSCVVIIAAQESGRVGNLDWELSAEGVLTISGTGEIPDFERQESEWSANSHDIKEIKIGMGVTHIGDYAFYYFSGLKSVEIPNTVTSIGESAFENSGITAISLPGSINTIGKSAFAWCANLTSVELPAALSVVQEATFFKCTALSEVTFPPAVTRIDKQAFGFCPQLTSVTIGENVSVIGMEAFMECTGLKEINFPPQSRLGAIHTSAFHNTALQTIELPAGLMSITGNPFLGCTSLQEIRMVNGGNTYYKCEDGVLFDKSEAALLLYPAAKQGTTYEVPASVRKLGNEAFNYSSLKTIVLPTNLEVIGSAAFAECTALEMLHIPATVTGIDVTAFSGCSSLKEIRIDRATPIALTNDFYHLDALLCKLVVPGGAREAYRNAHGWRRFGKIIEAGEPDVTLSHSVAELGVNNTFLLEATLVTPGDDDNETYVIQWKSGDEKIAKVDENGKVTGLKEGSTTITVNIEGYEYAVSTCQVTVRFIPVTDIELSDKERELPVGGRFQLEATMYPEDASDKEFIFSSGNPEVATVDKLGWVRAVGVGTTTITVTTANSTEAALCYVTVNGEGGSVDNIKIKENQPVVRTEPNAALVSLTEETQVRVYELSGHLVYARRLGPGEHRIRLRKGVYILTAGGEPYKLMIRQ